ncbi:DNA-binding transcriptional regulator, LysR family [Pseudomonas taetrolens]|uniref:DNA-binding transcriptional regulator, LysR family n=1 Tax=Pseudomonas taetrolens TaxID=47884 RepID=A0A1H4R8C2_PSETA|nr:LysR family transcriptional regulator [Pseudomonas taetrolens]SEC27931.1 DNA-binding transcriptional regulator, LysR family [Pseudomonas taetrolens]SQF86272.1 LysR family transcriptional regulator [Pseudomonas taetrolens]VEH49349.1 LysR family transcriptional regulator [Pseudomonas taetrolens]
MLNPQWLRTFVMLSREGTFTRAAECLDLTQAAVSQHVQRLEAQLGPLLIRRPRRVELTPAGDALLIYCAELLAADQRLHQRLSAKDDEHGEISLISPGSIGLALYPHILDWQQVYPGLSVRHRFAPDSEVLSAVLENRFELGLVTLRPDDRRLRVSLFAEEPLELVAPAGAGVNDWSDLERLGFMDHPDGQAMAGRLLSRYFPDAPGVGSLSVSGYTNQITLILESVARGIGFTVIPRYARLAFARPEAIQVIESGARVVDTLWLLHRAEWALSARAERLLEHLRQNIL